MPASVGDGVESESPHQFTPFGSRPEQAKTDRQNAECSLAGDLKKEPDHLANAPKESNSLTVATDIYPLRNASQPRILAERPAEPGEPAKTVCVRRHRN